MKIKKQLIGECKCSCGNTVIKSYNYLTRGGIRVIKSCGCKNNVKNVGGLSSTKEYDIWYSMIDRCYNPNNHAYKNYGQRGITVCTEWVNDFIKFYEWTKVSGYKDNLSLDRIDNNRGYSPKNCRWVTLKEQQRNRRSNVKIKYNGITYTLYELAEHLDINPDYFYRHIKSGKTVYNILNLNPPKYNTYRHYKG